MVICYFIIKIKLKMFKIGNKFKNKSYFKIFIDNNRYHLVYFNALDLMFFFKDCCPIQMERLT